MQRWPRRGHGEQGWAGIGGYRPQAGPDAAAAARRHAAERAAHRLVLEVEHLRDEGVTGQAALARALNARSVAPPAGRGAWTHTTVERVMRWAAA